MSAISLPRLGQAKFVPDFFTFLKKARAFLRHQVSTNHKARSRLLRVLKARTFLRHHAPTNHKARSSLLRVLKSAHTVHIPSLSSCVWKKQHLAAAAAANSSQYIADNCRFLKIPPSCFRKKNTPTTLIFSNNVSTISQPSRFR